jgi:hypothetical protein
MKEKRLLVALGALSAALAACGSTAETPGPSAMNPDGTGTGGIGSVTTPGGGSTSTTPGGGSGPVDTGVCTMGIPVTTQIPRMMNRQYANTVRDLLGVTDVDGKPVADSLIGDFTGAMTNAAWSQYQATASKIATAVMAGPNKSKFISCDPTDEACLKTTIETFGRKAFRRAMRPEETTKFLALNHATPAGTPDQVATAILNAFLISPSFLLIPELATDKEGNFIKLSQQEIASRLSFMLWGSVPDDALTAAADANQLADKAGILAQAQRMIAMRDKTGSLISSFHDDWVQMNNSAAHWFKGDHDPAVFPEYQPAAKASYRAEMDKFFEEVAYSNGSYKDLLTSNVAFVNKDNAGIYGLDPSMYTADLQKVMLTDAANPRPGFMTRAGFLSSYASYGVTSPILRGAFISVNLLSVNPGAPIPGAAQKTVDGTFTTQKAYVTALTQTMQPCKGCHDVVNPAGYVLESYSAIGKWQTKDPKGGAIDASITTNTVNFGDNVAKDISSPGQLMDEISKMPKAQGLYAKAWVSFAYGRDPNDNDNCTVQTLQSSLAKDGYSILSLVADLTQADSFRLRVRGTP